MSDTFGPLDSPPRVGAEADPTGLDEGIAKTFGETPKAADPFADDKKLLQLMEDCKKEALDQRWVFERVWWRNLLYVLGRQWIFYDKKRGTWVDKRMAKWIPRPVTNKFAEASEALLAMLSSINLQVYARPVGTGSDNVAAAEVADEIEPYLKSEHRIEETMRTADFWSIVTGNTFLHPFWDPTAAEGEVLIPFEQCSMCNMTHSPQEAQASGGFCPECKAPLSPAMEEGEPLMEAVNEGRGRTEALSPFEVAVPSSYKSLEEAPFVIRMRFRPKRWYDENMPDLSKKLRFQSSPSERSLQLLRAIANQADNTGLMQSFGFGGAIEPNAQGIPEYELWLKPSRDYPNGCFLRVAGEGSEARVVRGEGSDPGPLPYHDREGRPLFNWLHLPFHTLGGRLWGRSPLDMCVQKQDQINQLDSLMQLGVQRMSNPIWLKPKGAEIRSFTGEPGFVVEYNPLSAGGQAKPEKIEGSNMPVTLFQLREQYIHDFEQLAGTLDVLKGTTPKGVEAFSTLQLLVERAQSRFATVFKERGKVYQRWYSMVLELEREYGPSERVLAVTKPNSGYTFKHFERAKLQGAIEIMVEDGSQAPKTNLGRRAAIEHANQLGLLNPKDPEQQFAILKGFGLSDLVPSLDFDVKSALAEQDAFEDWVVNNQAMMPQVGMAVQMFQQQMMQWSQVAQSSMVIGGMPPPQPQLPALSPFDHKLYHNPVVHFAEHRKWANSDKAKEMFAAMPFLEVLFLQHLEATKAAAMAEMMGGAPGAPAPEPPKRGGAMERSNSESGNPADVPSGNREGAQRQGPQ